MWAQFSRKLAAQINAPRHAGMFTEIETAESQLHLAIGYAGELAYGEKVAFYWLVNRADGVVAEARFQAFGPPALIGAAEAACELTVGKTYEQARRLKAEMLDRQLRDRPETPAFPVAAHPLLELVVQGLEATAATCEGIPVSAVYVTPMADLGGEGGGYPGWEALNGEQKLQAIEEVIRVDILPYVEMDAGGVQVVELRHEREVVIAYSGSCTSCFAATGSTLSAIQQILQNKLHPSLTVTPTL